MTNKILPILLMTILTISLSGIAYAETQKSNFDFDTQLDSNIEFIESVSLSPIKQNDQTATIQVTLKLSEMWKFMGNDSLNLNIVLMSEPRKSIGSTLTMDDSKSGVINILEKTIPISELGLFESGDTEITLLVSDGTESSDMYTFSLEPFTLNAEPGLNAESPDQTSTTPVPVDTDKPEFGTPILVNNHNIISFTVSEIYQYGKTATIQVTFDQSAVDNLADNEKLVLAYGFSNGDIANGLSSGGLTFTDNLKDGTSNVLEKEISLDALTKIKEGITTVDLSVTSIVMNTDTDKAKFYKKISDFTFTLLPIPEPTQNFNSDIKVDGAIVSHYDPISFTTGDTSVIVTVTLNPNAVDDNIDERVGVIVVFTSGSETTSDTLTIKDDLKEGTSNVLEKEISTIKLSSILDDIINLSVKGVAVLDDGTVGYRAGFGESSKDITVKAKVDKICGYSDISPLEYGEMTAKQQKSVFFKPGVDETTNIQPTGISFTVGDWMLNDRVVVEKLHTSIDGTSDDNIMIGNIIANQEFKFETTLNFVNATSYINSIGNTITQTTTISSTCD